jgi:hypothetical protein
MAEPHSPDLRRTVLEIVHNQLRDGTPAETRATLERLVAAGHTRQQALELIGCVVATEIFDVLKRGASYNETRYLAALRTLPRLPWENEGRT